MPITGNGNGISNINFNGVVVEEMFFNGTSVYTNARYMTATGGSITTSGDFRTHKFTGSGTFTITNSGNVAGNNSFTTYLAGGGGGTSGITGFTNEHEVIGSNGSAGSSSKISLSGTTLSTATGGSGGSFSINTLAFYNLSGNFIVGSYAGTKGTNYSSGPFTGTGGNGAVLNNRLNQSSFTAPSSADGQRGTGVGSSGGAGAWSGTGDGVWGAQVWYGNKGNTAGTAKTLTRSGNAGESYAITVGSGGNGTSFRGLTSAGQRFIWRSGGGGHGQVKITYRFQN